MDESKLNATFEKIDAEQSTGVRDNVEIVDKVIEKKKLSTKAKAILIFVIGIAVAVGIMIAINWYNENLFSHYVDLMLREYPYAYNAMAADGSYLKIDTNRYDKEFDDMTYAEALLYVKESKDSVEGIKFMNKKLGFTDALYTKMMETTALMGRQAEDNSKFKVSWTYHPVKGLEVMYEKK